MPRLTLHKFDVVLFEPSQASHLTANGDWWLISAADNPETWGDAMVEGTSLQMLALAVAIEARGSVGFKRCAVRVENQRVFFRSPKNSQVEAECSLAEADALVTKIRETIRP